MKIEGAVLREANKPLTIETLELNLLVKEKCL